MMRSHGWDRDLPEWKQKELRKKYKCSEFDALYNFYLPGFNLRATDLQAFLGLRAIDKLDDYVIKRQNNFVLYCNLIKNNQLKLTNNKNNVISNFAMPIVHKKRDDIINELIKHGVEVRPLIAGNMATKPMGEKLFNKQIFTNAELLNKYGFYIPNHHDLTKSEIQFITNIINKF